MNSFDKLEEYLRIWEEETLSGPQPEGAHLSGETLYSLARAGGVQNAEPAAAEHLSRCARCLRQWADWRKALTALEGPSQEEPPLTACGMLKAAAAPERQEPLTLKSDCGRFTIRILPQLGEPERGMIAVEASPEHAAGLEGKEVTLRDRRGRVLLQGRLRQGRVARRAQDLSGIDLGTWTLMLDAPEPASV
jgi:hypothetical protein